MKVVSLRAEPKQPVSVSVENRLSDYLQKVFLPHMPSVSLSVRLPASTSVPSPKSSGRQIDVIAGASLGVRLAI